MQKENCCAKTCGIYDIVEKHRRSSGLSRDISDTVQSFYRREDISLYMPGKQDVVTVRDEMGKRKEQKRVLTMTVKEVYSLFKEEYPDIKVGRSKFAEFRPAIIFKYA